MDAKENGTEAFEAASPAPKKDEPARVIPAKEKPFTQAEMRKVFNFMMKIDKKIWRDLPKDLKFNRSGTELEREFKKKWEEILKAYPEETETVEAENGDVEGEPRPDDPINGSVDIEA